MNVQEALPFADEVVFAKTGKHLDDMQVGVIEGVLKRQKYGDIAQGLNCTEGYAKDVGYEVGELFSDAFGEEVNKLNLRSALIRKSRINNVTAGVITGYHVAHNHVIGSLNICTLQEESPEFLRGKLQAKIEAIQRLQAVVLTDEQIAKCLDMTLEEIRQVDLTEEKIEQRLMADGFPGSSLDRASDIQFWQLAHPESCRTNDIAPNSNRHNPFFSGFK